MTEARSYVVETPDGRSLDIAEVGPQEGPVLITHHGTPGAGRLYRSQIESAERRGLRMIAYSRPGYGRSTPRPERNVADAAGDVAAILDSLGVERFATYGWSGGGPHALACAALLAGRCEAAATIAGLGPADAPDLDWVAGMGEGNVAEVAAARDGRERLTAYCRADADGILAASPVQLADAFRPQLSDVDSRALTSELAAFLLGSMTAGLASGVDGWVDDDYALLAPWGFDVGAIEVPVLVWQGEQDRLVPAAHARWLRGHVAGAEGPALPEEGHLTLFANRVDEVHEWLRNRLSESTHSVA